MRVFSSGFDASEYETEDMSRHGHHVPTSFYHRFTRDACKFAQRYSRGRIISVLEGGYSDKALISGAFAHVTGLADVRGLTEQGWWNLKALDEVRRSFHYVLHSPISLRFSELCDIRWTFLLTIFYSLRRQRRSGAEGPLELTRWMDGSNVPWRYSICWKHHRMQMRR